MSHYDHVDPQVTNPKVFISTSEAKLKDQDKKLMKALDSQVGGSHYTQGAIQPLEYIMANNMNFIQGNIIKYVTRYRFKGTPKQDLEKVKHYVDLLIDHHNEVGWDD